MNLHSKIVEGIKQLLHEQDYVVVPNFGGFVTQVHFSQYLIDKNILTPPGKIISFNKQLRQNDGVLAFWLQSHMQITADVAMKHIHEFSDYCQQVLNAKRRLSLDNLGFFYLDLENNVCFEPKNDSNYLLESFGLSSVILNELPVIETPTEPVKETVFVDRKPDEAKQELPIKRKRNYKPLAYVALGGSILFFTLATLVNLNKTEGPLLSGLFNSSNTKAYKPLPYSDLVIQKTIEDTKPYVANANGIAVLELNNKTIAVAVSENLNTNSDASANSHSASYTSSKFQIVLGCFSMKNNAEKMVRKLKRDQINAQIAGTNAKGMHVVSCAGFNSKEDAQNYLSEIKSNFPTAWIKSDN
ncbi:MAG: SPOR domain-containing protein [Sphingobacteriaceae bacterium]